LFALPFGRQGQFLCLKTCPSTDIEYIIFKLCKKMSITYVHGHVEGGPLTTTTTRVATQNDENIARSMSLGVISPSLKNAINSDDSPVKVIPQNFHYRYNGELNNSGRQISDNLRSLEDLRISGVNTKSKGYVFTVNHYTENMFAELKSAASSLLDSGKLQYFAVSREIGAQKTPHLQGCVFFKKRVRIAYVAEHVICVTKHSCWPYLAVARGSMEANEKYVGKDPVDGVVFSLGEPLPQLTGQGARTDIENAVLAAQADGTSELDIVNAHPSVYVKYHKALVRIRAKAQFARANMIRLSGVTIHWYFGETGSGKSHYVHSLIGDNPETFHKSPGTKWFDGYDSHSTVWLDEFRSDWFSFAFMLRLFDPYAKLAVEEKGGFLRMVANRFYVTSCMHPCEMWYNAKGGSGRSKRHYTDKCEQLLRRIYSHGDIVEFSRDDSCSNISFTRKKWSHAQSILKLEEVRREIDGEFATHPRFNLM